MQLLQKKYLLVIYVTFHYYYVAVKDCVVRLKFYILFLAYICICSSLTVLLKYFFTRYINKAKYTFEKQQQTRRYSTCY